MAHRYEQTLAIVPTEEGGIEVRLGGPNGTPLAPAMALMDFIKRGIASIDEKRAKLAA